MINSKLIDLLSNLSKQEAKFLSKLIYSPAFNQHKDVTKLYEYLSSLPRFNEELLDPKIVFKQLFPKEKFNDLKLRHVLSYLLKIAEECLVQSDLAKQELEYKRLLLRAYRQHGLYRHFKNDLLVLKKSAPAQSQRSKEKHLSIALINNEAYEASRLLGQAGLEFLEEGDDALDLFFILSKLKNACAKLSAGTSILSDHLLKSVLEKIQANNLTELPEVATYYAAFLAYQSPDKPGLFHQFKEKIGQHSARLDKEELKTLLALAIQFCNQRLKENQIEYESELFEIYLHGLATEALLINQKLSYDHLKNIVDLGLKLQEIGWVEDFITESQQLTEKSLQQELFQLNTLKVLLAKNNYSAALTHSQSAEFKHPALLQDALKLQLDLFEKLGKQTEYKAVARKLRLIQRNLKEKAL